MRHAYRALAVFVALIPVQTFAQVNHQAVLEVTRFLFDDESKELRFSEEALRSIIPSEILFTIGFTSEAPGTVSQGLLRGVVIAMAADYLIMVDRKSSSQYVFVATKPQAHALRMRIAEVLRARRDLHPVASANTGAVSRWTESVKVTSHRVEETGVRLAWNWQVFRLRSSLWSDGKVSPIDVAGSLGSILEELKDLNRIEKVASQLRDTDAERSRHMVDLKLTSSFASSREAKEGALVVVQGGHWEIPASYHVLHRTPQGPVLVRVADANYSVERTAWKPDFEDIKFRNPLDELTFDRVLALRKTKSGSFLQALTVYAAHGYGESGLQVVTTSGERFRIAASSHDLENLNRLAIGVKKGESFFEAITRFNLTGPAWRGIDTRLAIDEKELNSRILFPSDEYLEAKRKKTAIESLIHKTRQSRLQSCSKVHLKPGS